MSRAGRVIVVAMILGCALVVGGILAIAQLGDPLIWGSSPPPAADLEERSAGLFLVCAATGIVVAYVVTTTRSIRVHRAMVVLATLAVGVLLVAGVSYDERYPIDRSLRFSDAEAVLSDHLFAAIDEAAPQGDPSVIELETPWESDSYRPHCYSMLGESTESARQQVEGRLTAEEVAKIDLDALSAAFVARGYPAGPPTNGEPAFRHQIIEREDGSVFVSLETPCLPE